LRSTISIGMVVKELSENVYKPSGLKISEMNKSKIVAERLPNKREPNKD